MLRPTPSVPTVGTADSCYYYCWGLVQREVGTCWNVDHWRCPWTCRRQELIRWFYQHCVGSPRGSPSEKTARRVASFGKFMANVSGPCSSWSRLLISSVNSVLMCSLSLAVNHNHDISGTPWPFTHPLILRITVVMDGRNFNLIQIKLFWIMR